ncbi:phosphatidylethanolamine-binding protein [Podospora aff. communis PSN243]|uniref:Phosphatidylethanolamine-binding protein n=1 Tax=Podospora aff. communis PSN243 TaxID=3040156 RepID=A0AAV9GQ59_9PEZI|nr:phosphatidylethanolamine-binding protein [Podospora aff. communis PSN243]
MLFANPCVFVLLLFSDTLAAAALKHQHILELNIAGANAILGGAKEVQKSLKRAEIIPTVVDDFVPSALLEVRWSSGEAALGNTLKPKKLEDAPSISLSDLSGHRDHGAEFVITLTDPDAPSRKDPKWSEFCHWIATARGLSPETTDGTPETSPRFGPAHLNEVMPYKPPGPPEDTGKHRYVFLVLVAKNGTTEELHLSKPSDRKHWGYDTDEDETRGVRDWAEENGLIPVAANFIYAKH